MIKALMMVAWGLILSTVGMDLITGKFRFTYSLLFLQDGIHVIPLVIGLFGLREVLSSFETALKGELLTNRIKGFLPRCRTGRIRLNRSFAVGFWGFSWESCRGSPRWFPLSFPTGWKRNYRSTRRNLERGDRRGGRARSVQ